MTRNDKPRFGSASLDLLPYWTEADAAELDLLTHELVKAVYAHRDGCQVCCQDGPWCEPLNEAFDGVLEWRKGRLLRSKASWLRARQQAREDLGVAA